MATSITINCSGALFSSIQFQLINQRKIQRFPPNKNSLRELFHAFLEAVVDYILPKNKEGFLLGQVEKFTSHSISDSEIDNENVNIILNLTGFIPCTAMGTFYSGSGKVNFEYLKKTLQDNFEKVVGWYHSRRMSEIIFLKEMRIHEQLREGMPHADGHFLFALFSRLQPAESGTMDVNYRFQIMLNNNEFEGVPLRLVNMSDTSTSQYIRAAPSSALYSSRSLQSILATFKNVEPGIKEAEQLHAGLLNQLRSLLPKYASIQERHHQILQVVNKLQECCHRSEIKAEFQAGQEKDCDFDLMDFESLSPKHNAQQATASKGTTTIGAKVSPPTSQSDPFGFVEKELAKQQEKDVSVKKTTKTKKEQTPVINTRSESEKINNSKVKAKGKITRKNSGNGGARITRNPAQGSKQNQSPSSSPSRRGSKEITVKNHIPASKTKSIRGANSSDDKTSNEKHRSPSAGKKFQPKLKEKESWPDNKMVTD